MSLSLAFFLMADSNLGTNFFYFPGKIQKMMTGTKRQCLNRIHMIVYDVKRILQSQTKIE